MVQKKSEYNVFLVAGPNSKYKKAGVKPAGFFVGFWHGLIAPIVFIIGLFTDKVKVYETNNNGRWYDFGFLIGIGAFTNSAKNTVTY